MKDAGNVLVVYPDDFHCYAKFARKVKYFTSTLADIEMIGISDANDFIRAFSKDRDVAYTLYSEREEAIARSTHAVIFNDKGVFDSLIKHLRDLSIPTRVVSLNLTIVVNKDKTPVYDVYIGRGTVWGNPYQIGTDGDRDEVIRKFKYDFERGFLKAHQDFQHNIDMLKGKVIACHCKPAACHGDVIAKYINSLDDEE